MSLVSNENKSMLWDLIKGSFELNNTTKKNKMKILKYLEQQCRLYDKKSYKSNKTIKELNQQILLDVNNEVNKIINNVSNKDINNPNNMENLYNRKGKDFENKLKKQQENFSQMMNGHIPDEIDFSDNVDNAMNANNMDYVMNQTLADREKALIKITNKYNDKKALKWINNDNTNQVNNDNIVKLNIKENIEVQNIEHLEPVPKRVSFNFERNEINKSMDTNFGKINAERINDKIVSELEQIRTNQLNENLVSNEIMNQKFEKFSSEILSVLDTIKENQDMILKLLGKKMNIELKGPTFAKTNDKII
tara:strand:- start:609 stop:1529 length:921 start_codon:yes stop_codon:yes gene_type:complete